MASLMRTATLNKRDIHAYGYGYKVYGALAGMYVPTDSNRCPQGDGVVAI
jgi:hypothetical protein